MQSPVCKLCHQSPGNGCCSSQPSGQLQCKPALRSPAHPSANTASLTIVSLVKGRRILQFSHRKSAHLWTYSAARSILLLLFWVNSRWQCPHEGREQLLQALPVMVKLVRSDQAHAVFLGPFTLACCGSARDIAVVRSAAASYFCRPSELSTLEPRKRVYESCSKVPRRANTNT